MKKTLLLFCIALTSFAFTHGQIWAERASGFPLTSTGISQISIVDAQVAWATGYDGTGNNTNIQRFTKTVDGGLTWRAGNINLGNMGLGIGCITASDTNTAWVAAYPTSGGQIGGVWKTTNGGTSWARQHSATFNSPTSFVNIVHFFDANRGIAIGDPVGSTWEVYTTLDGGATWTRLPVFALPAAQSSETGYTGSFAVSGSSLWFTTNQGRLFRTTDSGSTWTVHNTPVADFGGASVNADIDFSSPTQGIIQTNTRNLFTTTDGGSTWNPVTVTSSVQPFGGDISYVPGTNRLVSTGSATGASGSAYSRNNGRTWTTIDAIQHLTVAFFSETVGYSGGFSTTSTTNGMFVYNGAVLNQSQSAFAKAIHAYPNPTSNILNIESSLGIDQIEVFNLQGQKVMQIDVNTAFYPLHLNSLQDGPYFVKVAKGSHVETIKIIKQ